MRSIVLVLCSIANVVTAATAPLQGADKLSFERHVRPILKTYCLDCHGGEEKLQGNLDLRLARLVIKGGDSGPAIVPGKAVQSRLLERLKAGEMPPTAKKVSAEQIAIIEKWIKEGAHADRVEPEKLPPGINITSEERAFWSFQPLRRPELPQFQSGANSLRTPVDYFTLAKLRAQGLEFAPEADKLTLIRRVAFDLTGLPPTEAEIAEFNADQAELAYEQMVDRYLASPHYGERWARHWLAMQTARATALKIRCVPMPGGIATMSFVRSTAISR